MGVIFSIMDTGECLRTEERVISSRQVEEYKGHVGRFIKSISDLLADVKCVAV